ncbi:hypothetical protein GE21DRAFT_1330762 [Neurospora crassa]|nr:hypothetical protein GE21DRAFT_1330762 [Neurospora crassa]
MQLVSVPSALTALKATAAQPSDSKTNGRNLAKRGAAFWIGVFMNLSGIHIVNGICRFYW